MKIGRLPNIATSKRRCKRAEIRENTRYIQRRLIRSAFKNLLDNQVYKSLNIFFSIFFILLRVFLSFQMELIKVYSD